MTCQACGSTPLEEMDVLSIRKLCEKCEQTYRKALHALNSEEGEPLIRRREKAVYLAYLDSEPWQRKRFQLFEHAGDAMLKVSLYRHDDWNSVIRYSPQVRFPTYANLKFPEWAEVEIRPIPRCEKCGARKGCEVHHASYERMGRENMSDIFVLCRSCHEDVHRGGDLPSRKLVSREPNGIQALATEMVSKIRETGEGTFLVGKMSFSLERKYDEKGVFP